MFYERSIGEPRVDWKSLRKVRWTAIYEVLRQYLRTRVLPDGLTRRTKRRLVLLGDIMTYEPATGTVALYTRTARPEETDKTGKPLLPSAEPTRYRVVAPGEVDTLIEETFKSKTTGSMRGVATIFKIIEKSYLGITRKAVRAGLMRIETFRTRLAPKPREIEPYDPEKMPWQRCHADLLDPFRLLDPSGLQRLSRPVPRPGPVAPLAPVAPVRPGDLRPRGRPTAREIHCP